MVEIKKISIRRKVYQLGIQKKYTYTRTYKVKQKKPMEKLQETLQRTFKNWTARKPEEQKPSTPAPGGFNKIIVGGTVLLAALLLLSAWIYFTLQTPQGPQPSVVAVEPRMENEVLAAGTITAGDRTEQQYVGYVTLQTTVHGVTSGRVNITPYAEELPSEIFVLVSERTQADGYNAFMQALRAQLGQRKKSISEITVRELEQAPEGAIVLVPSGNIPKELLGIESQTHVTQLMDRGFVIVYIGLPFTSMLDGRVNIPTPRTVQDELGFRFVEGRAEQQSTGEFALYQPLYSVVGANARTVYGSVSVIQRGDGAILFLPQTLDGGWRQDMNAAAQDVARLIFETRWTEPATASKGYAFNISEEMVHRFFTEPVEQTEGSVKIDFEAFGENGDLLQQEFIVLPLQKKARGELYIADGFATTPTYLSGEPVRMNARLNEPQPGARFLFLSVENASGQMGELVSRGEVNLVGEILFDVPIQLDTGEYIASIVDDENYVYAQTYLKVASVDIIYRGERSGQYMFEIVKGNEEVRLDGTVRVDDGEYGEYAFTDTSEISIDLMPVTGGENLPYGEHYFTFTLGEVERTMTVNRSRPTTFFDNPFFLVIVVLSIAIVGGGLYFARKEQSSYQLDIPDFPPISHTKIPLRSETVLSLFEKVNENYRWKTTPLTVAELKSGFKSTFYKGKPIFISDYNMEYVLDQLAGRQLVEEFLNYYAPLDWTKKSGNSIRYLCLFRKLRDIFVNNAVPFTPRGEGKDYDTKITIVGQEMYVHLFESPQPDAVSPLVAHVLSTVSQGIGIIVFRDIQEKRTFQSILASTSPALLTLKMEVEGGTVMLRTLEEFEGMVRDLKGL